jgi:hypothetical protein
MSTDKTILGHPVGLFTLLQRWGRTAIMRTPMLILFMTPAIGQSGFESFCGRGGALYGLYTALVYD